jgi:hypothetical protein
MSRQRTAWEWHVLRARLLWYAGAASADADDRSEGYDEERVRLANHRISRALRILRVVDRRIMNAICIELEATP